MNALRYGLAGLQVGHPFAPRYRPAPPDSPREREIRRRAALDRDRGLHARDWPQEDREAWKQDQKGHLRMLLSYEVARHPDRLEAPPRWPEQIALLLTAVPLWALSDSTWSLRALKRSLLLMPAWHYHGKARTAARRRSARRRGITPRDAPRLVVPLELWVSALAAPLFVLWRRRRGVPSPGKLPWAMWLATEIVKAIDERRSYDAAFRRTSTGAPDSSDATAASQTAAAA